MPESFSWRIPRTDRVILVGKTGSGKTTLARVFLAQYRYVVVHDAKGLIDWPGYVLARSLADLDYWARSGIERVIYRPSARELQDDNAQETFFRWVYLRKNTVLYVDELYSLMGVSQTPPPSYLACLTRGRERGIGTWSATQRPSRIPLVAISEAEHAFVFRLRLDKDRRRMEDEWGVSRKDQEKLSDSGHTFYYIGPEGGVRGPLRLALP